MHNRRGFSAWEEIIVVGLIAIFVNVVYYRYELVKRKTLSVQTRYELTNLRFAVKLFKMKYGRYPANLYELYKKNLLYYSLKRVRKIDNRYFLEDGFGNPYIYDNKTGSVKLSPKTVKLIGE